MFRFSLYMLPLLWIVALAGYVLAGIALIPLHGDEPTLIYMGRDFYYQFVQGDLTQVRYRDWDTLSGEESTQQNLRLMNGTVAKYLYGFTAYTGGYTLESINDQWVWGAGWDWNHDSGHVPTDDLLLRSRFVSALLFALGIPVIYVIGHSLSGHSAALIASGLYALHPALLLNGRRAMMESSFVLFSLLVVLAGLLAVRQRKWWAYLLLGAVSGLAVAAKHTAVVTVTAIFAACLLDGLLHHRADLLRIVMRLFAAGMLALTVFYALNPAWWDAPLERAREVTAMRSSFIESQLSAFGGYGSWQAQLQGFLRQTFAAPLMFAEVPTDDFIARQQDMIRAYEQSGLAGWNPGAFLLVPLAIFGMFRLWWMRSRSASTAVIIGVWILAMIALTLAATPLEWQRYYLPIYPVVALLAAAGAAAIIEFLHRWLPLRQEPQDHV